LFAIEQWFNLTLSTDSRVVAPALIREIKDNSILGKLLNYKLTLARLQIDVWPVESL